MILAYLSDSFNRENLLYSYLDPASISLFLAAIASGLTTAFVVIRGRIVTIIKIIKSIFKR